MSALWRAHLQLRDGAYVLAANPSPDPPGVHTVRIAMSTSTPLAAVVFSSLLLGACAKHGSTPESETAAAAPTTTVVAEPIAPMSPEPVAETPAPPPVEEAPAVEPLNDAQIAKILETVDTAEIEQAKLAQKKSKNPGVKKFAAHMIQQHTKSKQKGGALAKKAKITPADSSVSTELSGKATALTESLKTADASAIDALYIEGQATQHQEVLTLVDSRLLPSATHEDLKSLLTEVRTMVETHVGEAKTLQESLASAPAAAPAAP
jgi:putative membrane protein